MSEPDLDALRGRLDTLRAEVSSVFVGQEHVVEELLIGILSRGHVLIEGVPGLGKTTLVRVLARALDMDFRRIQFTPDLMPGDILGTRILHEDESGRRSFTFEPGPVFTNVLLADEINRATPRTQSALLEAMQESSVTLYGETHPIEDPFFLVATENPIEMEGTYPLPEAQVDRFLLKIVVEYPSRADLLRILEAPGEDGVASVKAALSKRDLRELRDLAAEVPTSSEIRRAVASVVLATHPDGEDATEAIRHYVRYGASPRGGRALLMAARARALIAGRLHVAPEDVAAVACPTLRHRLILNYEGEAAGVSADDLLSEIVPLR